MYLAAKGARVTVVGRDKTRGAEVVEELGRLNGQENAFLACDLSLVKEAVKLANEFDSPLDYLVLSSGIATIQGRTETPEGLDVKMSLHYYSRVAMARTFAQTNQHLSCMFILSGGVHSPYLESDLGLVSNYSLSHAANAAGFYTDIACQALSEEFPSIRVVHAAPGIVSTSWGTEMPWYLKGPIRFLQATPLMTTPEDCAEKLGPGLIAAEPGWYISKEGQNVKPLKEQETAKDTVWGHTLEILDDISKK
jgi:NAD(P)-dependent dehydrogenase (short-subunit alcohol dehydrogenase family)